jgi:hypothetical protein
MLCHALQTIENFLEITKSYQLGSPQLFKNDPMDTADWLALITSKDLSSIHRGLSSPVQPFTSPFIGMSVDEVTEWFKTNVAQPELPGYNIEIFIIFNDESVMDEVCTVVSIFDEQAERLRCEFKLGLEVVNWIDHQGSMEECAGAFCRTGEVMTKENRELALSGGMYLDGMEVKIDEYWRQFSQK